MVSILIIVSLITTLAIIFMNHKFGYKKDSYGREIKIKVRNAFKIVLILVCLIPIVNLIVSFIYVSYSLDSYRYYIDLELENESNKIIKWLFR
jgi:hypothetical protein